MHGTPLPFARGSTYCEGDTAAIALLDDSLVGQIFSDKDPTTGIEQQVVVCKATAALTAPGGRGVKFDAAQLFKKTAAFVDSAGLVGLVADPQQSGDVADGDLFFCAWDGEFSGVKVDTTNLTLGGLLQFSSSGYMLPLANADGACMGVACGAVTAAAAGAVTATVNLQAPRSGQNV